MPPFPRHLDFVRRHPASLLAVSLLLLLPPLWACAPDDGLPGEGQATADTESTAESGDPPLLALGLVVDALNEEILRATLDEGSVPNILAVLEGGACLEHAVTHFPSVTAAAMATIWNGAHGNVTGIAGNQQHSLPRDRHTVMDRTRGFHYAPLSAEPIWITAGRHGVRMGGHHVTQGPAVPGYPLHLSTDDPAPMEARRQEAAEALDAPGLYVFNGYNTLIEPHRVLGPEDVTPADPAAWADLEPAEGEPPPRAFTWTTGAGTHYGAFLGSDGSYDRVLVNTRPRVEGSIVAWAEPAETASLDGRELARHFSDALELPVEGGRVHLRIRLFELSEDGEDFFLFHPSLQIVEGNTPEAQAAYEDAVQGWLGNSALAMYGGGAFGPTLMDGGDGTAENRVLETAELMVRQWERGAEWMWRHGGPQLFLDYFPLGDTADHQLLGYLNEAWPGFEPELAEQVRAFRARVWALVDHRVGHVRTLAQEVDAPFFLMGDHGMRTSWFQFLPNRALADAGLLFLDEDGDVDLSRTRAVSPNGYWISVNSTVWRDGIVPPDEVAEVVAEARAALEAVRGPDGEPVVTRTFTPEENPEFGLGGPAGGDLYFATAPGYRWSWRHWGEPVEEAGIWGSHGFPPDEPDMFTVFCVEGSDFAPTRLPWRPTTVMAPTMAEAVGLPAPRDAVDASILDEFRR
ncbi:MAG: hypothetical protein EA422_05925 [Gemmatimonadales bacterium]|nr:MAG: hypothetical protein EA422_05925 [Gemmatimonadales bacterium]